MKRGDEKKERINKSKYTRSLKRQTKKERDREPIL
jgi:hypothetical protein